MRRSAVKLLLMRTSRVLLVPGMKPARLRQYYEQEAFEATRRFNESKTYPGAIRVATPGDTNHYQGSARSLIHASERHYWRAVVDDPLVEANVSIRVRFKDKVWVTTGWEQRMHVVQVVVPRRATIREVIHEVTFANQSPYLCMNPFTLAVDGRELDVNKSIEELGLNELSAIDAIDSVVDHVEHLPGDHRPKDWNVDEITERDAEQSPYHEMGYPGTHSLAPRYQARPLGGFKGMRTNDGFSRTSKK